MRPPTPRGDFTLIGEANALLLRAISGTGPQAAEAYRGWRALTTIDEAMAGARRVLPLVVDMIRKEGLSDPEFDRMRGVSRHVWTRNTHNVRVLVAALDALIAEGLHPMLLKGLALFARTPEFMGKRAAGDGDLLVRPEDLGRAAAALGAAGFAPAGGLWEDFSTPLIDSETSGMAVRLGQQVAPLDLHWRPLPNIDDPALTDAILARADRLTLQGRPVLVPAVPDQVFLALARCEKWNEDECFTRLVEAWLLLSANPTAMDWPALKGQVEHYGLEATAAAFLGDLARHGGVAVPEGLSAGLAAKVSEAARTEWAIRAIAPARRNEQQRETLRRSDQRAHRRHWRVGLPTEHEIRLRQRGLGAATASALWRALRARVPAGEVVDIQFLEGFSYPETDGRWSTGHWSALAVPLTTAQRAGAPVRLNAHAFLGRREEARIVAYAGGEPANRIQYKPDQTADLEVVARPLAELGGAGLILLWLPDAQAPAVAGDSSDPRELGLFIRRQWQLPGRSRDAGQPRLVARLRTIYRRLPLPLALRARISPGLGRLLGRAVARTAPLPLPLQAIRRGDVVLSALLSEQSGIGRAGRMTRESLMTWGVPVVVHDITSDLSADRVPEVEAGGVWICHCNAPEALTVLLAGTERLWAKRYRIGYWAYELPRLPDDWLPALRQFHEIWAPSQFVADAIRRSSDAGGPLVRVVPHPMPLGKPAPAEPRRRQRPMTFLSMFDARSASARKNPMGAVRAFQMAFEPSSREVTLMVKAAHANADSSALRDLRAAIADWPNISLLTEHLSDDETLALIARADCLVSLHRSEGFGLPIAEAMSVGTPAIITGWSAPIEFSKGAAIEVGYSLVSITDHSKRYEGMGQVWAEPDLAEAARAMRQLAADASLWEALSSGGIAAVRDRMSQPIAGTAYRRFLVPGSAGDAGPDAR